METELMVGVVVFLLICLTCLLINFVVAGIKQRQEDRKTQEQLTAYSKGEQQE